MLFLRYFHSADQEDPARIGWQIIWEKSYFEDIKCLVKTKYIHKIEKKNSIGVGVFGYVNWVKYLIYVSRTCFEEKQVDFFIIKEEDKRHYIVNKRLMVNKWLRCLKTVNSLH